MKSATTMRAQKSPGFLGADPVICLMITWDELTNQRCRHSQRWIACCFTWLYLCQQTKQICKSIQNRQHLVLLNSKQRNLKARSKQAADCLTGFKITQLQNHVKTGSILPYRIQRITAAKPGQNGPHLALLDSNQPNCAASRKLKRTAYFQN